MLEGHDLSHGSATEHPVENEGEAKGVEPGLNRKDIRAAIAKAQNLCNVRLSGKPGADGVFGHLEMHGILSAETGSPEPAMPIEDWRNVGQTLLTQAIATLIEIAVEGQATAVPQEWLLIDTSEPRTKRAHSMPAVPRLS